MGLIIDSSWVVGTFVTVARLKLDGGKFRLLMDGWTDRWLTAVASVTRSSRGQRPVQQMRRNNFDLERHHAATRACKNTRVRAGRCWRPGSSAYMRKGSHLKSDNTGCNRPSTTARAQ